MKTIYILILLALVFGCHSSENSSEGTLGITGNRGGITKAETPPEAEDALQDSEEGRPIVVQPDKIIKTADIMFEVTDYRKSKKRADSLVNIWGGYISDENERSSNFRINNTMVIRISN